MKHLLRLALGALGAVLTWFGYKLLLPAPPPAEVATQIDYIEAQYDSVWAQLDSLRTVLDDHQDNADFTPPCEAMP